MAMDKTRTIVWKALSWPSTVVHIHTVDDGINGHGLAVGKTDGDIQGKNLARTEITLPAAGGG